jgi:hypothetical protein
MVQQCANGLFARAVCGPLDGLVRPVTVALALAVAIGLLAGGGRLVPSSSTVAESARSRPSAADIGAQGFDRDETRGANDDGYLEGLLKARDDDS